MDRFTHLALAAARQAESDSGLEIVDAAVEANSVSDRQLMERFDPQEIELLDLRVGAVGALGNDFDAGNFEQQGNDACAHQRVIVGMPHKTLADGGCFKPNERPFQVLARRDFAQGIGQLRGVALRMARDDGCIPQLPRPAPRTSSRCATTLCSTN